MQTVVLGPHVDLHPGFHVSMIESGPEDVFFHRREARHHFPFPASPPAPPDQAPFARPHLGELVEFGSGPQVVHSPRWPVIGRRSWVVDLDDLGFPTLLGRYFMNPEVVGSDGELAAPEAFVETVRRRARNMLRAYAHESCKALLFWTQRALDEARVWIRDLALEDLGEHVLAKSRVLYPAQRPLLGPLLRQKWRRPEPLHVLFVGRDYEVKQGAVALDVFTRLAGEFPSVRFSYVGEIPEADRSRSAAIEHQESLSRREILGLFRDAHVLFHPSRAESFGMVFAEAQAHGLAVVAARGTETAQVDEIFPDGEVLLLDRDVVAPEDEPERFTELLGSLLREPDFARRLGLAGYEQALDGPCSVTRRNFALRALYHQAEQDPAPTGVSLESIDAEPDPSCWLALSSQTVKDGERAFRLAHGLDRLNFYVGSFEFSEALRSRSLETTAGDPAVGSPSMT